MTCRLNVSIKIVLLKKSIVNQSNRELPNSNNIYMYIYIRSSRFRGIQTFRKLFQTHYIQKSHPLAKHRFTLADSQMSTLWCMFPAVRRMRYLQLRMNPASGASIRSRRTDRSSINLIYSRRWVEPVARMGYRLLGAGALWHGVIRIYNTLREILF